MGKSSGVRQAVGAIILHADQVLLVRKVRMMDAVGGATTISPEWDFPKGGIKDEDVEAEVALMRELHEELGSAQFRVLRKLPILDFQFSSAVSQALGFRKQKTEMFLVEFFGEPHKLDPKDEEIDVVKFVEKAELMQYLAHSESRQYVAALFEQELSPPSLAA